MKVVKYEDVRGCMENAIERFNFLLEQKKKKKKSRSVPILNLNVYLEHPFICISFFFYSMLLHCRTASKLEFELVKLAPKLQFLKGVYILGVYILRCEVP